jgi:hypothetical protein
MLAAPFVVFRKYLIMVPRSLPRRRDAAAAKNKIADVQRRKRRGRAETLPKQVKYNSAAVQ